MRSRKIQQRIQQPHSPIGEDLVNVSSTTFFVVLFDFFLIISFYKSKNSRSSKENNDKKGAIQAGTKKDSSTEDYGSYGSA
jgi:hypothetical protein